MRTALLCVALATLTFPAGCTETRRGPGLPRTTPGADASTGTTSGVPSTLTVASLDAAQLRQLCEWSIGVQGGPGRMVECPGGGSTTTSTEADCTGGLSGTTISCDITVGEVEDCFVAIGTDLCGLLDGPACAPFVACGMARSSDL